MIPRDELLWEMMEAYKEGSDATDCMTRALDTYNKAIQDGKVPTKPEDFSDGFHTFGELYDHRRALTAALFSMETVESWRSKEHHPNNYPMFEGCFIVGAYLPQGQISYHYKLKHWDDFKYVPVKEHAPFWDGHTSESVVNRIFEWVNGPKNDS